MTRTAEPTAAESATHEPATAQSPAAQAQAVPALADVLVRTLRALGEAGRPVQANRLAARAWWLLREPWPRQAERINGTMHFLARLPDEQEIPATDRRETR